MKNTLLFILLMSGSFLFAQNGMITGKVFDKDQAVPYITIALEGTVSMVTTTDENGKFRLSNVPFGKYILKVQSTEHEPIERTVDLSQ